MTTGNASAKGTGGRNSSPQPAGGTSGSASLDVTQNKLGAVMDNGGDHITIPNNRELNIATTGVITGREPKDILASKKPSRSTKPAPNESYRHQVKAVLGVYENSSVRSVGTINESNPDARNFVRAMTGQVRSELMQHTNESSQPPLEPGDFALLENLRNSGQESSVLLAHATSVSNGSVVNKIAPGVVHNSTSGLNIPDAEKTRQVIFHSSQGSKHNSLHADNTVTVERKTPSECHERQSQTERFNDDADEVHYDALARPATNPPDYRDSGSYDLDGRTPPIVARYPVIDSFVRDTFPPANINHQTVNRGDSSSA